MTKETNPARKIVLAGTALLGAVALSGGFAYRAINQIKIGGPIYGQLSESKDLVADILPPPEYVIETYLNVLQLAHTKTAADRPALIGRLNQLEKEYDDRHAYWAANLPAGETREKLLGNSYTPAKAVFTLIHDQLLPAIESNDQAKAIAVVMGPIKTQYELHRAAIDQVVALAGVDARQIEAHAADVDRGSNYAFGALGGVLAAAMGVVGMLMFKQLRTGQKIRTLSGTLGECSDYIASASSQVAAASQSLASGASEQAASLEETSSSLEEISSMTKKNADTAHQASVLSTEAKAVSDKGNAAMAKMSTAIADIQKSAAETAKIIKTIDEIAFQTNLLALNAAVEAARAGEAGKGFAVVAEEVRNLAMRSAEAAKNTAALIDGSVTNAKNGVVIADEVARNLEEITAASGKVNLLIAEIAAACQEQSTGIGTVNQSIQEMDKVTQSNAAAAEESAASAEELSTQSEQLSRVVSDLTRLVLGDGAAVATAAPVRAASRVAKAPSVAQKTHTFKAPATPQIKRNEIPLEDADTKNDDFADFNIAA